MGCHFPLQGMRRKGSSEKPVICRLSKADIDGVRDLGMEYLELPCNRCMGCRMDRRRSWSIRCVHEAQLHEHSVFLTGTYDNEHLPKSLSLEVGDHQSFMKRLRKAMGAGVRFFCAGEYGGETSRPHWHYLLFNCDFPDKERLANGYYRSSVAESLWRYGNVTLGDVTPASAAYVAGYTSEKVYGDPDHYEDVVSLRTGEVFARRPPFVVMSRNPGIGGKWFDRFQDDVFPHDGAVVDGKVWKVPRYYLERLDPEVAEAVREARKARAKEVPPEEKTEERREVREAVLKARLDLFNSRRL